MELAGDLAVMEVVTCAILSSPLHRGIEQNDVIPGDSYCYCFSEGHKTQGQGKGKKKVGNRPCSISFPGSPVPQSDF